MTIAMDDFGTGYSSLGYLQKFRFDKIKIDRSFVSACDRWPWGGDRARGAPDESCDGHCVNAEGVEHERQAAMLHEEGCEEVQGFLFSRAVEVGEFAELLARNRPARPRETVAA